MEKATQKIEHDKIVARAKAWEEDALARIESRNQREEAKINAEELTMKNKAEARLRKNEEKLEKMKATYLEQMKNEIAAAHKAAEEKRALVAAKKGQDILKTEEMAAKIRATGIFPKKFGCFAA
jgi:multidrug efflux pump subunit AcrA (membrane-fusion protein)